MAITQQQIAEHLGVSRSLVARALRGHSEVSLETRDRVRKAARVLGYNAHSNHNARALASRRYGRHARSGIIAVMGMLFEGLPLRGVPFFVPMLDGIELEAARFETDICLCMLRPPSLPRLITERGVDGIVCISIPPRYLRELQALDIPVAALDVRLDWAHSLLPDYAEGTRLAVRHLAQLEHERIAYLNIAADDPDDYLPSTLHLEGFRQEMAAQGLAVEENWIVAPQIGPTISTGHAAMKQLLARENLSDHKPRPDFTAVVCHNDLVAMGAIREAQTAGLETPRDLSFIGFDDVAEQYDFAPTLTSVRFDRAAMGRRAIEILSREPDGAICHESFPVELVIRDSTRAL